MAYPSSDLSTPSIPAAYSRLAARTLGLHEKGLNKLLYRTGLSNRDLMRDDIQLTGYQQIQILSNALDISGDQAFGLAFGQKLTPPTHGPLGFLVNSSPTLIAALEAFRDYLPLRMHLTQISLRSNDRWLECVMEINPQVSDKVFRVFVEAVSLSLLAITAFILDRPLKEGVLQLSYPAPAYQPQYEEACPCQVVFSAEENLLRIPIALANTANLSSEHGNYEYALSQCREQLRQLNRDHAATHIQVKRILLSNPNHQMSEEEVAAALFIGKRTLARRLQRENTGFRQLREEVLASLAEGYLLDTQLSVEAVASLLNYHDASNFRRAFRRWHDMPPERFRRIHSSGET